MVLCTMTKPISRGDRRVMTNLHLIHGTKDGDRAWLIAAANAKKNLISDPWIICKDAMPGDDAVFKIGNYLFATGRVGGEVKKGEPFYQDAKRDYAYRAPLHSIRLIDPPVSLEVVRQRLPDLAWARYPRTTKMLGPDDEALANKVRRLVQRPDLAIAGATEVPTTAKALVEARRGQGAWRSAVLERWNQACAVTGKTIPAMLRASHIKPWAQSSDRERLDADNGLMLTADLDALFDAGLISFDREGLVLASKWLELHELKQLVLYKQLSRKPNARQAAYLTIHRQTVFQR